MSLPTEIIIQKAGPGGFTGEYIVSLKDDECRPAVLLALGNEASAVTHQWNTKKHGFSGLGGPFNDSALSILKTLAPKVTSIVEDTYVRPAAVIQQQPINSAPWGLERLSSAAGLAGRNPNALNFEYHYNDHVVHAGDVDIYVIDAGINIAHPQLVGRVVRDPNTDFSLIPNNPRVEGQHGTWVASIIGSDAFGVTKDVTCRLIDIKVVPGGTAAVMDALAYVRNRAAQTMNLSVVNYSFGSIAPPNVLTDTHNRALHNAFVMTTGAGIHVVAAAGNDMQDVDTVVDCPSHLSSVITVGATGINDGIWINGPNDGSNFGVSVDVFAPGETITGAGAALGMPIFTGSGTSAAAPHVAGLVAYLLKLEGPRTPQEMKDRIRVLARHNTVNHGIVDTTRDLAANVL
ncbi:peptidase S8/S53 domain-containing protein [Amanita rubescens]|nr:peptidase S8/S53 domain-containing protein [Amanita rubescens]